LYNNSANTKFTGKSILFLPSCHSTNTIALEKVRSREATNGLIVITNNQISGRGQRGNTWLSEAGANLTLSVVYLPENLPVNKSFYLNIVSSLAVSKTIKRFLPSKTISVKWPNDIYSNKKKLSGILIETSIQQQNISSVVIGIGINVNEQIIPIPTASSMLQEAGYSFNLNELFQILIENIEQYYLLLINESYEELFIQYSENMFLLNEQHTFRDSTGEFNGIITGITENGQLIIQKDSGNIETYHFKEVEYIIQSS
jgi:BirA family biotin operon repressor/biotin-[acetyl-CoA-carboxylase] ligase